MTQGIKQLETKIVIVGEERWSTFAVFNGNAYPRSVSEVVDSCSTRAAIFLLMVIEVQLQVSRDRNKFTESLEQQKNDLTLALTSRPDLHTVAYYDGLGYLAALYSCLVALKSFLDVYSQLMARVVSPRVSMTFKRGKIGEELLSGGALINWLRRSAPPSFNKSEALADLTYHHSKQWITPSVKLRDTLAHYADLATMRHMNVRLRSKPPIFEVQEIVEPTMPNGSPVISHCLWLLEQLRCYVSGSVILLPNVKQEMISPQRFLILRQ